MRGVSFSQKIAWIGDHTNSIRPITTAQDKTAKASSFQPLATKGGCFGTVPTWMGCII